MMHFLLLLQSVATSFKKGTLIENIANKSDLSEKSKSFKKIIVVMSGLLIDLTLMVSKSLHELELLACVSSSTSFNSLKQKSIIKVSRKDGCDVKKPDETITHSFVSVKILRLSVTVLHT